MALIISITAFVTVLFMGMVLIKQPEKVNAEIIVSLPIIDQGSFLSLPNYLYYYMAVSSYVITWIMTALLLKDYIMKVGKIQILVCTNSSVNILSKSVTSNAIWSIHAGGYRREFEFSNVVSLFLYSKFASWRHFVFGSVFLNHMKVRYN